jgi:hypothetical protein
MTPGGGGLGLGSHSGDVAQRPCQQRRTAAKTSLGRQVVPSTECRLPGVVSVVTIRMAPLLAQLPLLAVVSRCLATPVSDSPVRHIPLTTQPGPAIALWP